MDRSAGIVVVVSDDNWFSVVVDSGGLDDVVLAPLVIGLRLRFESLSPISSSWSARLLFVVVCFSSFKEFASSSSVTFTDDGRTLDVPSSVFANNGGVGGILNDWFLLVELGVTVVLDPRRFPLRKIRSLESCVDGIDVNCWSRLWFCFVERTSDLYRRKNSHCQTTTN